MQRKIILVCLTHQPCSLSHAHEPLYEHSREDYLYDSAGAHHNNCMPCHNNWETCTCTPHLLRLFVKNEMERPHLLPGPTVGMAWQGGGKGVGKKGGKQPFYPVSEENLAH